jgi:hypothetical protein
MFPAAPRRRRSLPRSPGRRLPPPHPPRGEGETTCGINGVPAVVVEGKWLISGGQPVGAFEEALRGMAGNA